MTAKVTGRVRSSYSSAPTAETLDLNIVQDNKRILSEEVWEIPDRKRKEKMSVELQKGKDILDLNNVQKPVSVDRSPNDPNKEQDTEVSDENREIAFFTEPKTVKRKTQRHIFVFQAITAVTVCLIMLLLKIFAPELYDNLHLYYVRLFQW